MSLGQAVTKLESENAALRRVLARLVRLYVADPEKDCQFVACVTPDGNIPEWDDAMRMLGKKPHPKRRLSKMKMRS